jgi:hypothetical protein
MRPDDDAGEDEDLPFVVEDFPALTARLFAAAHGQGDMPRPYGAMSHRGRRGGGGDGEYQLSDFSYEALSALDDKIVKVGFTPQQIARLPVIHMKPATLVALPEPERTCSICLCEYEGDDQVTLLPCFCRFHTACINTWLEHNKTCPKDRERIPID